MGLMDTIVSFEEDQSADEQHDATKCENFRYGYQGPYCIWHEDECCGPCSDWNLSDFWRTKKGY